MVVAEPVAVGSQRDRVTRLLRRVVRIVRLKVPNLGGRRMGRMRPGML